MIGPREFAARLRALVGRSRRERVLDDEIREHLELLTEAHERRGLSRRAARAAARRDFGGVLQTHEAFRDQWTWAGLSTLRQDVTYGVRMFRRRPGFAATATLSLGIAIGATTTVYGVLDAVFYSALPVDRPGDLVLVKPQLQANRWILPNPIFERLRDEQTSLTALAAVNDGPFTKARFEDGAWRFVQASRVSGSYFPMLGLTPAVGRLLNEDDDRQGEADSCAAVLGYAFWSQQFARAPDVLGRVVQVNSARCTVVGVAPEQYRSHLAGYTTDVWLPLRPLTSKGDLENYFGAFFSGVIGRLRPGVSAAQAEAALTVAYRRVIERAPPPPPDIPDEPVRAGDVSIRLENGAHGLDTLRRQFGSSLQILLTLVGLVLVLAGFNVAHLALARGMSRTSELVTRGALGATSRRLVAQLVTEGCLLVALGVAAGLALAMLATPVLASFVVLDYTNISIRPGTTLRTAAIVAAAAAVLALAVAVFPAWRLTRNSGWAAMQTRWASETRARQRAMRTLVVVQIALSLTLVAASGLLVRTMTGIARIAPGFRPDRVLLFDVDDVRRPAPRGTRAVSSEDARAARIARYASLETRLRAVPGVETAGLSWLGFFGSSDQWTRVTPDGHRGDRPSARIDYVSPDYFDAVGMIMRTGRGFRGDDWTGAPRVAVINETMARRWLANDAIGRTLEIDTSSERGRPFTVVGVVGDSKYNDLRERQAEPMMWVPLAQVALPMGSVTVRVAPGPVSDVTARIREAIAADGSDFLVRRTMPLTARMDARLRRERLLLGFAAVFGALALLLAAIGVYGTLAEAVTRRRRELGVRLALGAAPRALSRMVVGDALRLTGLGVILGVPLALLAGRTIRGFLYGVSPTDPAVLIVSIGLVVGVTAVAAYLPSRRASSPRVLDVLRE